MKTITWDAQEGPGATSYPHPSSVQRPLDTFHLPKVFEELEILLHRYRVQNSIDRGIDLVFQRENIPPNFSMRIF